MIRGLRHSEVQIGHQLRPILTDFDRMDTCHGTPALRLGHRRGIDADVLLAHDEPNLS